MKIMEEKELEIVSGGAYNGSVFLYTVQEGDSLSMIAHRFGTTVAVLIEINNLHAAVRPGTRLLVPIRG